MTIQQITRRCLSLAALALTTALATGQTVSGRITDSHNGEPLVGATVHVDGSNNGTAADMGGQYAIKVGRGQRTLVYSFMGYETQRISIAAHADTTVSIALQLSATDIDEVTVTSEDKREKLSRPEMGVEKMHAQAIKSVPVLMGETDVIKVMQLMPGVQAASEGSTGFSVRGGNPDQNLVLLDGATIYNAGHFMGFFSVFNNDAVNDVKLYKGDMPANYGGRLASMLEVNTRDGDKHRYHLNGGVGLISSRLTVDGPIVNNRTSFLASARRTYFDIFLPFATNDMAKESKIFFYDLNARITHKINDNNHLFASAYLGRDKFTYPIAGMEFGNKSASLRWSHIYNSRNYLNVSFSMINSDYEVTMDMDETTKASLGSTIKDYGIRAEWSSKLGQTHQLLYGLTATLHNFRPGTAAGNGDASIYTTVAMPRNRALETSVFVANTETIGQQLTLRYGLRLSTFHNYGRTTLYGYDDNHEVADTTLTDGGIYHNNVGLEPRFALSYLIGDNSSIKASYTRSYQYLQQASASSSGTPMDVWYMTSPNVRPQLADQISAGYFHNFDDNRIELSFEAFYKSMKHTIDFKDHPSLMLNKFIEGELRFGSSRAFGCEFMAKADMGRWNGWVSYTLSKCDRRIDGVNDGKRYMSPYNHTHDVSAVATVRISERLSLSGNWVFISGAPTTFPVARYEVGGEIVPLYSSRNNDRMPNYHRLDLSATLQCKRNPGRKWKGEWVFSLYNAYNRHNTWAITFERDENNTSRVQAKSVYLFPIIPSVSYNFKF